MASPGPSRKPAYTVRMDDRTRGLMDDCLAYAGYLDRQHDTCAMLRAVLNRARAVYRKRCKSRSIDPDRVLAGVRAGAGKPMPDLRKPGPVVD